MWFSAIPCIWTIVVGTIVSLLFKPQDPKKLNPDLISPGLYQVFSWWPIKSINNYLLDLKIGSLWVKIFHWCLILITINYIKLQVKDEKYHRIVGQQIHMSNTTISQEMPPSNGLKNPGFEMSENIWYVNSEIFYAINITIKIKGKSF